jgi:hypothetical protein
VRVGVWKSSTDPTSHSTALTFETLVADPLRPYVYGISPNVGGVNNAVIQVVNVYTGAVVDTITPDQPVISSGSSAMAVSGDGKRLFVAEYGAAHVGVYDLETRTFVRSIPVIAPFGSQDYQSFAVLRVDGHELVVTSDGKAADADAGKLLIPIINGFPWNSIVHWDPYRSALYAISVGPTDGQTVRWSIDWIDPDGGAMVFETPQTQTLAALYSESGGLSPDGSILYAGAGSYQAATLAPAAGALPQTDPAGGGDLFQLRVGSDGRRYADYIGGTLYVFAADGTQLVREPVPQGEDELPLVVSADGVVVAISHQVFGLSTVDFKVY